MSYANTDIRVRLVEAGVTITELAEEIGILRPSLSRKLRKEVSEEDRARLLEAIAMVEKRKKSKRKKGVKRK